jgi:hypothetical protein
VQGALRTGAAAATGATATGAAASTSAAAQSLEAEGRLAVDRLEEVANYMIDYAGEELLHAYCVVLSQKHWPSVARYAIMLAYYAVCSAVCHELWLLNLCIAVCTLSLNSVTTSCIIQHLHYASVVLITVSTLLLQSSRTGVVEEFMEAERKAKRAEGDRDRSDL